MLSVKYKNIDEIKPYKNNTKRHTEEQIEQIKASIKQFGMNDPIALWKNDEIIEGHGRLEACKELGIKTVPVVYLDKLTNEQRKAYSIIHNKLTLNTPFDILKLEEELASIKNLDLSQYEFDIQIVCDNMDDFFCEEENHKEKKRKEVECPYCGGMINV